MTKCNPRTHVLAPRGECKRERIRHRPNLAGTPTGYKKDGCRCCDCKLWNTNRSRKERGMPELPTLSSAERPAERTEPAPARVRPERRSKPATVSHNVVQSEPQETEDAPEDFAEEPAEEPDEEPQQKSLLAVLGEMASSFRVNRPVMSVPMSRPMTASMPVTQTVTKSDRIQFRLMPFHPVSRACCVWEHGETAKCNAVVGDKEIWHYTVDGKPVCYEHYTQIKDVYPKRCRYFKPDYSWRNAPVNDSPRYG